MKRFRFMKDGGIFNAARFFPTALVCSFFLTSPESALAYVGPGAGLTMLGSGIALVIAIIIGLAGLIIWPVRLIMRRRRGISKDART